MLPRDLQPGYEVRSTLASAVVVAVFAVYAAVMIRFGFRKGLREKRIPRLSTSSDSGILEGEAAVREGWKYIAAGIAPAAVLAAFMAWINWQ